MCLSLKNKVSNWLGGEGRKYLPLEVCPGVKMIVLNNFVYCQAYNSPSIDGGCFNMMLLMIILYFLASSLGTARMSTVQSTQEHFHQKPSLGITPEVRILFRTGFVDKIDYPCLKSHKRNGQEHHLGNMITFTSKVCPNSSICTDCFYILCK